MRIGVWVNASRKRGRKREKKKSQNKLSERRREQKKKIKMTKKGRIDGSKTSIVTER